MNAPSLQELRTMRDYFSTHQTYDYGFRRKQLLALKSSILNHEKDLHDALYADLKKSPEESWVTETGFLLAEISHTLKHLGSWMKPARVRTNLLNFPSKSFLYKEPLGVVLIVGPWNYPLQLLFTPLVGAIAAGNCVVLKASEFAPATSAVMRKVIESSFPREYISYTDGDGATEIPAMMNAFRFDHVFYTGSTAVGKIVYEMAAKQLTPVTLELGGKSPCIVEADANIKVAAKRIALTKFSNAGQMCVAPDYVLVHESVKEEFTRLLRENILSFFQEDASTSYNYGKIINEKQFNRLTNYLQNAKVIYGGKFDAASNYIAPTLIEDVSGDMPLMKEEIFGPVLPLISFKNFEEAKEIIQQNPDPLAFYVFTESSSVEKNWLTEIPFGGGCVNNASWHLTNFNLPFGGRGKSGIGAYHGKYSFDVFSHHKGIMRTPTWFDPAIKYPPFKGKLKLFKKIIR
jgi:aldehyde dehydrogenase (NAD+)